MRSNNPATRPNMEKDVMEKDVMEKDVRKKTSGCI
jgi:hypothetical protein